MSDSEGHRPRKFQRRSEHVTLTPHSSSPDAIEAPVVVGQYLREDVVSRSGLLAGLRQTEGSASLPAQLTPGDIQLWHTACVLPFEPSHEELVKIMKVSDVLGDAYGCSDWLHECRARALCTEWKDPAAADAMAVALLQLPDHLLHDVLRYVVVDEDIDELLDAAPLALHTAIVASAAIRGRIHIPPSNPDRFLNALAAATFPPPALMSLTGPLHGLASATAALLGRTLAAHPSLTFLELSHGPIEPARLRTFASCLPAGALPALRSLHISVLAHPGGGPALLDCLRRITGLTELRVKVSFKAASTPGQTAMNPYLGSLLSPIHLPHMQSLCFSEDAACSGREAELTDRGQQEPSAIFLFLPAVKMPSLSSLTFRSRSTDVNFPRLVNILGNFPVLQELAVHARFCNESGELTSCPRPFVLPQLRSACINRDCVMGLLYIVPILTRPGTQALTHLSFGCSPVQELWTSLTKEYADVLAVVGRCTKLRHLDIPALPSPLPIGKDDNYSSVLWGGLRQLTRLTCLLLRSVGDRSQNAALCMLCAGVVAEGLLGLTALERLHFGRGAGSRSAQEHSRLAVDEPQVLLGACACMPRLRSLGLCVEGLQREDVVAVAPQLTQLTELALLESLFPEGAGAQLQGEGGSGGFAQVCQVRLVQ